MKKIPVIFLYIMFSSGLFAQGIYNNGGKIVLGTGATMYIAGTGGNYRNETSGTDGSIDLNGAIKMEGNLTNNVVATDVFSTIGTSGAVIFAGNSQQTIGGLTTAIFTFGNMTVNNTAGILFAKNAQVNGTLTLTAGLVDIGNNNFTFGAVAVISGTPSSASMIIATGTGQVFKNMTGIGAFTFPIGDNNLSAKYSPVVLNFTSGTFAPGAVTGLNLVNARYNDPILTGSYLNRYWNITQTGITGFICNASFQYLPADVVGNESNIYTLNISPPPIKTFDLANTATHMLTASGLTSFGTFTGGPGFITLNLSSVMLQGLYSGAGVMRQARDAVGPHWGVGIADNINIELHNAVTYATVVYTASNVPLSISGLATVNIPVANNGSYYITIRHRNSLATTSSVAVPFATPVVNQSFGTLSSAYGSNLALSTDSHYMIYGGDVNQDGVIDFSDFIGVDNDSYNYITGYVVTDVDGNGIVDFNDFILIDNNNYNYIVTVHP